MRIWVDADACPRLIKEVIYRAATRTKINTILVANKPLQIPKSPYIQKIQVSTEFDAADNKIIEELKEHDLVITADIPLAAKALDLGVEAIDPRGKHYTKINIKQILSLRNFHTELRNAGMITGGVSTLGTKEIENFANCLDRVLARHLKKNY